MWLCGPCIKIAFRIQVYKDINIWTKVGLTVADILFRLLRGVCLTRCVVFAQQTFMVSTNCNLTEPSSFGSPDVQFSCSSRLWGFCEEKGGFFLSVQVFTGYHCLVFPDGKTQFVIHFIRVRIKSRCTESCVFLKTVVPDKSCLNSYACSKAWKAK